MPFKRKLEKGQTRLSFTVANAAGDPAFVPKPPESLGREPLAEISPNKKPRTGGEHGVVDGEQEYKSNVLYTKKSSSAAAVVEDSITAYKLALQYLCESKVEWASLSEGDRRLRVKFDKMSRQSTQAYWELIRLLKTYVDKHVGVDGFDDCSTPFIWNWPTWHRTIIRLAESISSEKSLGVDPASTAKSVDQDCWFSHLSCDRAGRPKIPIRPGQIELRRDGNHSRRNMFEFYQIEGSSGKLETTASRVVTVLMCGVGGSQQSSHRCHNSPQLCVNPHHTIWESDAVNKSRNFCVNGCFTLCRHEIRCVWTDVAGRYLPHRNLDLETAGPCTCDSNCFKANVMGVEVITRLESPEISPVV